METKPGILTTEFWTNIVANVLALVQLIFGPIAVNNHYVVLAMAIINGLYMGSRGIAKAGVQFSGSQRVSDPTDHRS